MSKWIKWFVVAGAVPVAALLLLNALDITFTNDVQKGPSPETQASIAKLKERIEKDVPALKQNISDFEKVNLLRDWAYANIDFSSKKALLDDDTFDFYKKDVATLFSDFAEDKGGTWCGGTAYVLKKLYVAYGFKALASGSGDPNVMTHAFTIVQINYNGSKRSIIEDATFNLTYVDPDGAPYDYKELYSVLKQRRHDKIKFLYGNTTNRDFLFHPGDQRNDYDHCISKDSHPIQIMDDGVQKYRSEVTLARFQRKFGPSINKLLIRNGYPTDPIYLFLIGPDLPADNWTSFESVK